MKLMENRLQEDGSILLWLEILSDCLILQVCHKKSASTSFAGIV